MGCPEGAFCAHIEERETLSPRGKGTENAAAVAPRSQDRQARQETTGAAPSGNEEGAPPRGTQRKAARPRGDDDDRAHRRRQPGPSGKARHEAPLGPGEATLFCASCGSSPKPSEKGMSCPSRAQREPRTPKAEQGAVRPRPTNTRGQRTERGREPRAPNRCIAKLRQLSPLQVSLHSMRFCLRCFYCIKSAYPWRKYQGHVLLSTYFPQILHTSK